MYIFVENNFFVEFNVCTYDVVLTSLAYQENLTLFFPLLPLLSFSLDLLFRVTPRLTLLISFVNCWGASKYLAPDSCGR